MIHRPSVYLLFGALALLAVSGPLYAATITAASCNAADVQTGINTAAAGDTVVIPAGTCTWTTGVTVTGKGINLTGQGSGRVMAYDDGTMIAVGTGTKTFNIAGFSPGFSAASLVTGSTVRMLANNFTGTYMQGTITSYSGGVLTVNVTITAGTGSQRRWLVSTLPTTVIVNNNTSTPLFSITEDTTLHTSWSGIHVATGTGPQVMEIAYAAGGHAVLIHDCWIEQVNGNLDSVGFGTGRGVVWACSFTGNNGSYSLANASVFHVHSDGTNTAWTTPALWGSLDTTGENAVYIESSDFHCVLTADNDANGKLVFRYNLLDHSFFLTHGPDTSIWGDRYFEFYNNTGVFFPFSDLTTIALNGWVYLIRGGTFVIHDNNLPQQVSTDYGTKADFVMTVLNLTRNAGPNPCWGAGTTGGALYHSPRQVGFGYVTGMGTDGMGRTNDVTGYVGDSEPGYVWGNSRVPLTWGTVDDSPSGCTNPDTSANYIILGRDFFDGTTAKPNYTPYVYPHPLTGGTSTTPPTITTTSPLPTGGVGVAYSVQFTANGTTPITWSATSLPAGLSMSAVGLLSGIPTTAATTTINVTASNTVGSAGPMGFSITIGSCGITPTTLGPWTNTQVISQTITASSACGSSTWALTGLWPTNLSGCNTGTALTCTVTGTINVSAATHNAQLAWQDPTNPAGTTYDVYRAAGTCASNPTAFSQIISGVAALTYTNAVAPGTYCYRVTAVGAGGESLPSNTAGGTASSNWTPTVSYGTASNPYSIVVNPVPSFTTTSLPGGTVGAVYSQTLATTGGTAPLTCSVTAGALPAGVNLISNCQISGTPTTVGAYNFTIAVTDANGVAASQPLAITISGAITQGTKTSGGVSCRGCSFR